MAHMGGKCERTRSAGVALSRNRRAQMKKPIANENLKEMENMPTYCCSSEERALAVLRQVW